MRRSRTLLVILALYTAVGLLLSGYQHLEDVATAEPTPLLERLIEEMTSAWGAGLLLAAVIPLVRRFPLTRERWPASVGVHLAVLTAYSALHTTWNAVVRGALFPLAGLGAYDYGIMRVRYAMEFPMDVIAYVTFVGGLYAFDHYRSARDRELRTAQLEAQLAQAQLQNLRLQLQPHFLFNALNTISSVMYDDPRAADTMIAGLSELLRLSLRSAGRQEVTLHEELELLRHYVDIMRARFEERLTVWLRTEPGLEGAMVPSLLLQPLVENAIRHGNASLRGRGSVEVSARRENGTLILQVADDGPGLAVPRATALGKGLGLSGTVARLQQLYGAGHRFDLDRGEAGGLTVTVALPFRDSASSGLGTRDSALGYSAESLMPSAESR
ncbi:MAG: histidine kinase [Gemmatimonadaceae bacterium]